MISQRLLNADTVGSERWSDSLKGTQQMSVSLFYQSAYITSTSTGHWGDPSLEPASQEAPVIRGVVAMVALAFSSGSGQKPGFTVSLGELLLSLPPLLWRL